MADLVLPIPRAQKGGLGGVGGGGMGGRGGGMMGGGMGETWGWAEAWGWAETWGGGFFNVSVLAQRCR